MLSANDTYSAAQRQYMNMEYQQLKKQMVQIADNTEWNGFPIHNGSNDLALPSPMPAIGTQDLSINGVAIGIPQSAYDELSPLANDCHCRATTANTRPPNLNPALSKNETLNPSIHQEHFLL